MFFDRATVVVRVKFKRIDGFGAMDFDVFISYPSEDRVVAFAACAKLEAEGVRCWIAPRDVPPGVEWAGALVDAIDHCRAMVLIFSSRANESEQVRREVQRAFNRNVPVVPFRIENVVPEKSLAFFMESVHWLDALTPPLEQHLKTLATSVKSFLRDEAAGKEGSEERRERKAEPQYHLNEASYKAWSLSRGASLGLFVVSAALVASIGLWFAALHWKPALLPDSLREPSQTSTSGADTNATTLLTGLMGHWPLDGGATDWARGVTPDTSGNGHDGMLVNITKNVSSVPGKIGGALNFNGTNSVQTSYAGVSGASARSVSLWLKTTQNVPATRKNTSTILAYGYTGECGNPGYFVIASNDRYGGFVNFQGISVDFPCFAAVTYYTDIYDNKWHHLSVVMLMNPLIF